MRLPYIQVDGDFITQRSRSVAALLGCSHAQAIGHLSLLWGWVLSQGSDDAPPSGVITGQHAARLVRAAAEWEGSAEALVDVLSDPQVGLLERIPDGFRVRGLERYAKAWDKQRKDRERKQDVRRNSSGQATDGAGKTQTQTQKEEELPSAGADAPPEAQATLLEVEQPAAEKPPPVSRKPRKEASGPNAELWRTLEAEYERRMGSKYASGNGGADAATVSWLLANTTPPEAVRRWGNLLEWAKGGFPKVSGFVDLRSTWNAPQVVGLPVRRGSPQADAQEVGRGEEPEPFEGAPPPDPGAAAVWGKALRQWEAEGKRYALGWLRRVVPVGLTDGVLRLWVPDVYARNWLDEHYGAMVRDTLDVPTAWVVGQEAAA